MPDHECNRCGESKFAAEMCQRGGKPSSICRACFGAAHKKRGGGKKGAKSLADVVEKVTRRKAAKRTQAPTPIEITRSFGIRASIEDDSIALEQDQVAEDGSDLTVRVLLSHDELKRIAEWASR